MPSITRRIRRNIAKEEYKKQNKGITKRFRNFFVDIWHKLNGVHKYE